MISLLYSSENCVSKNSNLNEFLELKLPIKGGLRSSFKGEMRKTGKEIHKMSKNHPTRSRKYPSNKSKEDKDNTLQEQ
ncbi:hypothetical protein KY289_035636 [Solanum tuberosum]|nr:hypothetical protein KY289_035620 [Solanum tuberosum]KAH0635721.1 hypothetical protein KY289_035636 [Solanum tuberosum]